MSHIIVIVEDSIYFRQIVSCTLKSAGYQILEAENGRDALDKIQGVNVALFICDLNMPIMDGLEFVKVLKQQQHFKFTPVIMLTNESKDSKKQEGRHCGVKGWLQKPIEPEKLLHIVKKLLPN
ncbi:response regulator [Shewanella sp. VB17]|uniref:response regulator n=1 Tax=Shewanella sp. VB17 TaxID=2739432 RepID=UPI001567A328|nr:response regulator [Shewanella sp. VB17]NRD74240.1 response regulator [Shewanella sp. VB17]